MTRRAIAQLHIRRVVVDGGIGTQPIDTERLAAAIGARLDGGQTNGPARNGIHEAVAEAVAREVSRAAAPGASR